MMTDETPLPPDMEVFYSDDPPGPRSRRLRILAAITLVALVAGAGVGFIFTGHSSTSPTVSRSAPATTSPYALNNDPAPSLAGAYSDNLLVAFRALYAYHNWLYEHPDAALVANYAVPGSPAYKIELANIDYLVAHDAHAADDPRGLDGDISFIKVTLAPKAVLGPDGKQLMRNGHPTFGGGIVTIVAKYIEDDLYGPSGKFSQPGQHPGTAAIDYSLVQGANGQWLEYQASGLNPAGGPQSVEQ
ncbi:MAG TPA: hypothetical protein VNF50_13410 [Acidimicrobiales bacterium]|nr:hypothetical protein [Acidimicrobiales bacterium]